MCECVFLDAAELPIRSLPALKSTVTRRIYLRRILDESSPPCLFDRIIVVSDSLVSDSWLFSSWSKNYYMNDIIEQIIIILLLFFCHWPCCHWPVLHSSISAQCIKISLPDCQLRLANAEHNLLLQCSLSLSVFVWLCVCVQYSANPHQLFLTLFSLSLAVRFSFFLSFQCFKSLRVLDHGTYKNQSYMEMKLYNHSRFLSYTQTQTHTNGEQRKRRIKQQ